MFFSYDYKLSFPTCNVLVLTLLRPGPCPLAWPVATNHAVTKAGPITLSQTRGNIEGNILILKSFRIRRWTSKTCCKLGKTFPTRELNLVFFLAFYSAQIRIEDGQLGRSLSIRSIYRKCQGLLQERV